MKRIAMLIAAAALLNACGGGSDQAESQAPASNEPMASATAVQTRKFQSPNRVAAPQGIVTNRIDSRLRGRSGEVEVWVTLDQNSVAAQRAALAETSGIATAEGGELVKSMRAVKQGASQHKQRVSESQSALAASIAALGGREQARVQIAHNAIAVRIDASQLTQLASLQGVAKVRPVLNYEMTLARPCPMSAVRQCRRVASTATASASPCSTRASTTRTGTSAVPARPPPMRRPMAPAPRPAEQDARRLVPDRQGGRRLRLRRRGLADYRAAHRTPTRSTSTVMAHTSPTSLPARARTARTKAWRPAPSCWR